VLEIQPEAAIRFGIDHEKIKLAISTDGGIGSELDHGKTIPDTSQPAGAQPVLVVDKKTVADH